MGLLGFVGLYDPCLFLSADVAKGEAEAEAAGVVGLLVDPDSRLAGIDIACALVALLMSLGVFQFCILSHKLSAFMFTIGTLVSDVSRVIVVVVLLALAFSTALTRVENSAPFGTFQQSLYTLVRKTLLLDTPDLSNLSPVSYVFFLCYAFLATIGMLNVLVAQLDQNVHSLSRLTECFAIQVCAFRLFSDSGCSLHS